MTPGRFWAGLAAVGLAVEAFGLSHEDRNDWCASPNARRFFRADTPVGRALLTAGIGAGSTWLAHHLITIEGDPR